MYSMASITIIKTKWANNTDAINYTITIDKYGSINTIQCGAPVR